MAWRSNSFLVRRVILREHHVDLAQHRACARRHVVQVPDRGRHYVECAVRPARRHVRSLHRERWRSVAQPSGGGGRDAGAWARSNSHSGARRESRRWNMHDISMRRCRCSSCSRRHSSRPHAGRRPTGVLKRARCPRSQEKRPYGAGFPGTAGVPPAPGRRPAMDDPPKAHPCVQAGKMPALPGKAPAGRVDLPRETQNENCRGPGASWLRPCVWFRIADGSSPEVSSIHEAPAHGGYPVQSARSAAAAGTRRYFPTGREFAESGRTREPNRSMKAILLVTISLGVLVACEAPQVRETDVTEATALELVEDGRHGEAALQYVALSRNAEGAVART